MRVPRDLTPTPWARARAARGEVPFDLTASNPTACGIAYPRGLLEPLRDPAALRYRPDSKGIRSARDAVAREYEARGISVDPEHVVLTASSSESYSFLFKLLCDPGDAVLAPVPSYPLVPHLAALDGVGILPYRLDPTQDWQPHVREPDPTGLVRAAILVHPNNPTGSWVGRDAAEALARAGDRRPLPLIVDEVFLDYLLDDEAPGESYAGRSSGLTFTLGGLSKGRGLPQLKLSWIVVGGPQGEVETAVESLAFIADNYLSVATPIQDALPEILVRAAPVRDAIRARCIGNLAAARSVGDRVPGVAILPPAAGWGVIVRFPSVIGEETLALTLLERHGVAAYPGYFFDFPKDGFLVLSLLPEPAIFARGLDLTLETIASTL